MLGSANKDISVMSPGLAQWLESPIIVDQDQLFSEPCLTNLCDLDMMRFREGPNGLWINKSDGSLWKLTPNFDIVPALMNLKKKKS